MKRFALISVPYLWLFALFLVPFFIVLKISLSDFELSIPPYTPTLDLTIFTSPPPFPEVENQFSWPMNLVWDWICQPVITLSYTVLAWFKNIDLSADWTELKRVFGLSDIENYSWLASDDLYWKAYLSSVKIAFLSTVFTLIVAYPIAYGMSRAPDQWRPTLMMLIILPFWTSFLIRVYAWKAILAKAGLLNQLLMYIGIIQEPLIILNTNLAVYIGIVYTYLPFMVLPIYSALERMDESLLEAAQDLGSSRFSAFWLVTLPLSKQGIIAGSFLVFIPAMGEFVIPALLGGSKTLMIGKVLWEEFFNNRDWPIASAVAVILLLLLIIPIVMFQRSEEKQREAAK